MSRVAPSVASIRADTSCHQPDSISLRSSSDFKTSKAGMSMFATLPAGVINVASRSFDLEPAQSVLAESSEAGGTSTRIRSARYFSKERTRFAFGSVARLQNVPFGPVRTLPSGNPEVSLPERNTPKILLDANHTPEAR